MCIIFVRGYIKSEAFSGIELAYIPGWKGDGLNSMFYVMVMTQIQHYYL